MSIRHLATAADKVSTPEESPKRAPGRRSAKESRLTRDRLLVEAEKLFAMHGYAGTSVRDLSAALGIAGSSVLHHAGSKRKLYAAVLQRISDSLNIVLQHTDDKEPTVMLRKFVERLLLWSELHPDYSQILCRELMENPRRLSEIHHWHLAEFLERALEITAKATARASPRISQDMLLLSLLGSVIYFNLALPTFMAVRGGEARELKRRFVDTLDEMLRSALDSKPSAAIKAPRRA